GQDVMGDFIEAAPLSLAMTDRLMQVIHASPLWRTGMGLSDAASAVGRSLYDLLPGSKELWGASWERCLAGEVSSAERLRVTLPDGRKPWLRVEITPWRDAAGRIGGLLMLSQDVT